MLRAGVVSHPSQWQVSGYHEIQHPPSRYRIIDQQTLIELFNFRDSTSLQQYHNEWVETQIAKENPQRDPKWTEALAVGSENFIKKFQNNKTSKLDTGPLKNLKTPSLIEEPLLTYMDNFD